MCFCKAVENHSSECINILRKSLRRSRDFVSGTTAFNSSFEIPAHNLEQKLDAHILTRNTMRPLEKKSTSIVIVARMISYAKNSFTYTKG